MRKRVINRGSQDIPPPNHPWLHLDIVADVEVTSEDAAHPIELALIPGSESGWRAEHLDSRRFVFCFTSHRGSSE